MQINRIFLCILLILSLTFLAACSGASARSEEQDRSFIDSLTFLGDSTTAHMLKRAPLRDGEHSRQVWATASRYLNLDSKITYTKIICPDFSEEMTIAEAAARVKPHYLVITLGIDYGVYYYRNDLATFRFYYEKLLNEITSASPNTQLILQSIFPVARCCTVITNEMVDAANSEIRSIAASRGLFYLDSNRILRDESGYLCPQFCFSEDGIHLTRTAYEKIFSHISSLESAIKEANT